MKDKSYSKKTNDRKSRNKGGFNPNYDITSHTMSTPSYPKSKLNNVYTTTGSHDMLPGIIYTG